MCVYKTLKKKKKLFQNKVALIFSFLHPASTNISYSRKKYYHMIRKDQIINVF